MLKSSSLPTVTESAAISAKNTKVTSPRISVLFGCCTLFASEAGRRSIRLFAIQAIANVVAMEVNIHASTDSQKSSCIVFPASKSGCTLQLPQQERIGVGGFAILLRARGSDAVSGVIIDAQ
jgi:hypothetical protein